MSNCGPNLGYVVLPGFVGRGFVIKLLQFAQELSRQRVKVKGNETTWDELTVPSGHLIFQFFDTQVLEAIRTCGVIEVSKSHRLVCWLNHYRVGEYIAPHRDKKGSIQALICLKSPKNERNGGVLILSVKNRPTRLFLNQGDCVTFRATELEHSTTQLVATEDETSPERIVAVGRYFFQ